MRGIRNLFEKWNHKKTSSYGTKEFRSKIFRARLARVLKFVIPVLVIAVIVIVCRNQWDRRVFSTYEIVKEREYKWINGSTVLELKGNILAYSKDGMSCTDQNGKVLWNQTYEMQNPIVVQNGDKVAIGDYNGRTIYVCSTSKIMGTISTNLPIRNLTVSEEGIVAAVLEDSNVNWIKVFTVDGSNPITVKTQMKNSGYPLAVAFSPNSDLLGVSYLHMNEGKTATRIAFYNFGEVGQNYQDKLVSTYEYSGMIVPNLYFTDNEHCVAVGDNRLMFYQGGKIPKSIKEELLEKGTIEALYVSNGYTGICFGNDDTENRYLMKVYDSMGQNRFQYCYPFECTGFLVANEWALIYNEAECRMITLQGKEKLTQQFDVPMHLILPTDRAYKYTFWQGDYLNSVELK